MTDSKKSLITTLAAVLVFTGCATGEAPEFTFVQETDVFTAEENIAPEALRDIGGLYETDVPNVGKLTLVVLPVVERRTAQSLHGTLAVHYLAAPNENPQAGEPVGRFFDSKAASVFQQVEVFSKTQLVLQTTSGPNAAPERRILERLNTSDTLPELFNEADDLAAAAGEFIVGTGGSMELNLSLEPSDGPLEAPLPFNEDKMLQMVECVEELGKPVVIDHLATLGIRSIRGYTQASGAAPNFFPSAGELVITGDDWSTAANLLGAIDARLPRDPPPAPRNRESGFGCSAPGNAGGAWALLLAGLLLGATRRRR